ncbi:MAG TPA: tripartite tricarboxylate transporter permease [Thermodesulfobacteriota bacterium]|nr:tripartite tricarboxylate transporter permease [Thermodesulfobacteriota bacterium]
MGGAALEALAAFADPTRLGALLAGTVVGVLPGLGGTAAVSLLLPFVFGLDPPSAMALMVGAVAVVHTSDVLAAVLLAAPGSASAAVVMMDGHALARQGEAGRALAAAFLSSMLGGLIGTLGLTLSIPVARPLVLAFGSPEILLLCLIGISFAAALSEGKLVKGAIAALLGLLLGAIGAAPAAAEYRFTFGSAALMEGLPLVAVALGVFGLAELADLVGWRPAADRPAGTGGGWLEGVRDVVRHRWLVLRGALIGIWAGLLPGIGATAGTWMAYGHAVAASRDKSRFGKGDIRGVIAPESANNAVEAGDLVPTLLFGVPGGAPAAIMMGVLLVYGIQPGPRIVTGHLDLVYTIVWSFAIANVVGAGLACLMTPLLARLTRVPFARLAPAVLLVMLAGAYQERPHAGTLLALLLLGAAAWLMKRAGYPRAPLLIGYVLSLPTERYYWLTVNLHGTAWLARPWAVVLLLLLLASLAWGIRDTLATAARPGATAPAAGPAWSLGVSAGALALFAAALVASLDFSPAARLLPLLAAVPGVALALVQLLLDLRATRRPAAAATAPPEPVRPALAAFGWVGLFVLLLWLVGLRAATALFVPLFLLRTARLRWPAAAVYTAATLAALEGLTWLFGMTWPRGLLPLPGVTR